MRLIKIAIAIAGLWGALPIQPANAASSKSASSYSASDLSKECAKGNAGFCIAEGERFLAAGHFAESARHFHKACDLGAEKAICVVAGRIYRQYRVEKANDDEIFDLFNNACAGDETVGCVDMGILSEEGDILPKSNRLAARFYQRSCDAGHEAGCNYGRLLEKKLRAEGETQSAQGSVAQAPVTRSTGREAAGGSSAAPAPAAGSRVASSQAAQDTMPVLSRGQFHAECAVTLGGEEWHTLSDHAYNSVRATCECRHRHFPKTPTMSKSEYDRVRAACDQEDSLDSAAFLKKYWK